MSRNKSLVIALTDMRRAFHVRYVKLSLVMVARFGPILVIVMMVGPSLTMNPASSDYGIVMSIMMPMAAAILALMSVIPAGMISANSFVGEKEQRTLEPLLLVPLTDQQIIIGKTLSSLIPCIVLLYGGTLATTLVLSIILIVAGKPLILFPDLPGMFLIFVVGPIVVLGIISTMIIVSSHVSRVYEAYQTGSIASLVMLIPMMLPLMGSTGGGAIGIEYVWLSDILTFVIAVVIAVVTWAMALRMFNRDRMVSMI